MENSTGKTDKIRCKLCGCVFDANEMSEEHYPAHSVGNDDIVKFDFAKMIDMMMDTQVRDSVVNRMQNGEPFDKIAGEMFDNQLSESIYPKGRTARTLCRSCNTFLGHYDEAYLKFFNLDGDPKAIKGFQLKTKIAMVKSIYGKFLSIPEAQDEQFDFVDFLKDENALEYNGKWRIYFIRRDFSTDLLGFGDIQTGMAEFDEGIVYELSDEKFIFNLLNFHKHDEFEMTDLFDITDKDYKLVVGTGESGGYHASVFMTNFFKANGVVFDGDE